MDGYLAVEVNWQFLGRSPTEDLESPATYHRWDIAKTSTDCRTRPLEHPVHGPLEFAMQVMGGIGYTDVYPIERAVGDTRLAQIWTGTNEIMSAMNQHDYFEELLQEGGRYRDLEQDAMHPDESEKVLDDADVWRVYDEGK